MILEKGTILKSKENSKDYYIDEINEETGVVLYFILRYESFLSRNEWEQKVWESDDEYDKRIEKTYSERSSEDLVEGMYEYSEIINKFDKIVAVPLPSLKE